MLNVAFILTNIYLKNNSFRKYLIVFTLLFSLQTFAMEKEEDKEKSSFIIKYIKYPLYYSSHYTQRYTVGIEHLISRIVNHFDHTSFINRITVVNDWFEHNYVDGDTLKEIFKSYKYIEDDNLNGVLNVTRLITIIQNPLRNKLNEQIDTLKRDAYNAQNEHCETLRKIREEQIASLNETNKEIEVYAKRFEAQRDEIERLRRELKDNKRWFFQRHPKMAMAFTAMGCVPIYYGLHQLLNHYKIPLLELMYKNLTRIKSWNNSGGVSVDALWLWIKTHYMNS